MLAVAQRLATDGPRFLRATDAASLRAAVEASNAANNGEPFVIEMGPGVFDIQGGMLLTPNTHLRGQGATSSIIIGQVALSTNTRLSGLTARTVVSNSPAIAVDARDAGLVEVIDVVVEADTDLAAGLLVTEGSDQQTRLKLQDVRFEVAGGAFGVGLIDQKGIRIEIVDTTFTVGGNSALAIRFQRADGGLVDELTLRVDGMTANVFGVDEFACGIELLANAGSARIVGAEIRTLASTDEARAVSNTGVDVRINQSLFFANQPIFSAPGAGGVRLANTSHEPRLGAHLVFWQLQRGDLWGAERSMWAVNTLVGPGAFCVAKRPCRKDPYISLPTATDNARQRTS